MANSSIAKRLTKDLKRNPKRSAILGVLALVAIWFWFPLVKGWIAPEHKTPAASASAQEKQPAPTTNAASTALNLDWKQFSKQLEERKRREQQVAAAVNADAFSALEKLQEINTAAEEEEAAESQLDIAVAPMVADPTPESLGLELSSTLIGNQLALAVIGGQVCRRGTILVVPVADREYEYQVAEIHADEVALTAGEKMHLLTTKRKHDGVEIGRPAAASAAADGSADRVVVRPRSQHQKQPTEFVHELVQ